MNNKVLILSAIALTGALLLFGSQSLVTKTKTSDNFTVESFSSFRDTYTKKYSTPEEMEYRFTVFASNLEMIEKHNTDNKSSYTLGVNQFTDMTYEELKAKYLGFDADQQELNNESAPIFTPSAHSEENEVDWVKKGVVHPIKNQARCGSCWAFASTSALESLYAIQQKKGGLDLSEQELVDCSGNYGNEGCEGGLMHFAYAYVRDHKIHEAKVYPYTAVDEECKADSIEAEKFSLKGFAQVKRGVENVIKATVVQPVAVAFYVQNDFFAYKSGVYDPPGCNSRPNHAVTVVGYKKDAPKPYFLVKNSWGTTWGAQGFFQIAIKTGPGACNIAGHDWNYVPTL